MQSVLVVKDVYSSGDDFDCGCLRSDGGIVDEHVVTAIFRCDEPKAFGVVEPLHGTHGHGAFLKLLREMRKGHENRIWYLASAVRSLSITSPQ